MRLIRLLFPLFLLIPCMAQTTYPPINQPVFRAFDSNGKTLPGGFLFSYAAGTTTPLATYTDATGASPNTNPVVLDASGQAKIFMGPGSYKFILQDKNGVQQWTVDQILGAQSPGLISFNGRTAQAVVPTTGDYDCAMVTNCPTIPVLYYQTIQASGSPAVQEPILNFVAVGGVGALTVTAGGTGYTSAPAVSLSGGGCATEPTATATVASGAVTSGTVLTPGTGCTSAPAVSFTGGGGTGATATVVLSTANITCTDNPTNTSTDCLVSTASGSSVTSRTCTTGVTWSCYSIDADGTIHESGVAGPVPTGADTASVAITFPHAFTTTAALEFGAFPDNCSDTCAGKNPISVSGTGSSALTTTGNTLSVSGIVPVGGGGQTLNATIYIHWHATGN